MKKKHQQMYIKPNLLCNFIQQLILLWFLLFIQPTFIIHIIQRFDMDDVKLIRVRNNRGEKPRQWLFHNCI